MSTPLQLRQAIMNRLLNFYALLNQTDDAARIALQEEITALEATLTALDRNLIKIAPGLTEVSQTQKPVAAAGDERLVAQALAQGLKDKKMTRRELDQLLSKLGTQEFVSSVYEWVDVLQKTVARLKTYEAASRQYLAGLSPYNPYGLQGKMHDIVVSGPARYGFETLADFVNDQEERAKQYHASGKLDGLITALPLYLDDCERELNAWVTLENNRYRDGQRTIANQAMHQFIASQFNQKEARAAWRSVKRLARLITDRDQIHAQRPAFTWQPDAPVMLGPHPIGSTGATASVALPAASAIPRFVNEQGKPYANTQVLCWRYSRQNPDALGTINLDRLSPNLVTVGLLYTDHDGRPTLHKPDFLLKRGHCLELQVAHNQGNVLLLEISREAKPTQFVQDDPLLANWYSYGLPDHFANINQVISQCDGTPFRDVKTLQQASIVNEGLNTPGRMGELLSGSGLTGFYELAADFDYGFMLLPLGHGSLAINNLPQLPSATANGHAIAVKQRMRAGEHTVTLPTTLRQFTHECYQIRNQLFKTQQHMMRENQYKYEDIARIDQLKQWVDYVADYPAKGKKRLNQVAKSELHQALNDLQQGIRQTQFLKQANPSLNQPEEAGKYHIYLKQQKTAAAFQAYNRWVEAGFAALDNNTMMTRLQQWAEAQEDINEQVADRAANVLETESKRLAEEEKDDTATALPQLPWSPPKTLAVGLAAPYTPLLYDALLGVMSMLTQSHRDDEIYGKYLLPLVLKWLQHESLSAVMKSLSGSFAQIDLDFESRTADLTLDASKTNLVEKASPLEGLLGTALDVSKATFIRGPGAPALVEGILELSSMLLLVGFKANTQLHANVLMRTQLLQLVTLTGMSLTRHRQQISQIMVYFTRSTDRLRPIRLLNVDTLSTRAYGGETWGTGHVLTRFEGYLKTLSFAWTKFGQLAALLRPMKEEAWANPTAEDYRGACYHILQTASSVTNEASALLATPGMVQFWQQRLKLPQGKLMALLEKELAVTARAGAQMSVGANTAGKGMKFSRWLLTSETITDALAAGSKVSAMSVMSTWANRIAFVSSAVSFFICANEATHNLGLNRELEAIRSGVEMVGHGMIVVGAVLQSTFLMGLFGLNTIPVVGQALFVGGLIITIGLIAWDYYWQHWGRAHFFSDTFVVFDDTWDAMSEQPYFNEYLKVEYGADPDIAEACKRIENKSTETIVDAFRLERIAQTQIQQHTIETNISLRLGNKLTSLFGIKEARLLKVPDVQHDVRWENFNWLAGARLLEHKNFLISDKGELQADKVREMTDLEFNDISLAELIRGEPFTADSSRDKAEDAKVFLLEWLEGLKAIQQNYNQGSYEGTDQEAAAAATAEILWPALVNGEYPADYSPEALALAKYPIIAETRPHPERAQLVHQFLLRWQTLVKTNA